MFHLVLSVALLDCFSVLFIINFDETVSVDDVGQTLFSDDVSIETSESIEVVPEQSSGTASLSTFEVLVVGILTMILACILFLSIVVCTRR